MVEATFELQRELEAEVRDFEIRMARLEGQLDEKRSLLSRLRQAVHSPQPLDAPAPAAAPATVADGAVSVASGAGRRTISALGRHHYEVNGLRFPNAGQMLDHLDVPHYFSSKHPKQGDAAAREVMRWAKRNPSLASTVTVVLSDGTRVGLDAAVSDIWP